MDRPGESLGEPGRPRVPALHRPCLLLVGVALVLEPAFLFVERQEPALLVISTVLGTAMFVVHGLWLRALFNDGRRYLGKALPMDGTRALLIYMLSCVFVQIWTVGALRLLFRATQDRSAGAEPAAGSWLGRHLDRLRNMLWMALLNLVVVPSFFRALFEHVRLLGLTEQGWTALSVLGPGPVVAMGLFQLTVVGYYLFTVFRGVPALYRAYAQLPAPDES